MLYKTTTTTYPQKRHEIKSYLSENYTSKVIHLYDISRNIRIIGPYMYDKYDSGIYFTDNSDEQIVIQLYKIINKENIKYDF